MIVKCVFNLGAELPKEFFELGYTPQSVFHLQIGKPYSVYGMCLWSGKILLLVCDDNRLRCWAPVDLFSITDGTIPSWWEFSRSADPDSLVQALWGYKILVDISSGHYEALIELEKDAVIIFMAEVDKIEEQEMR